MKKLFMIAVVALVAAQCNNETASSSETKPTADSISKSDYAYLPENGQPDNWDRGDQKNLITALNCLKSFEKGDMEGALTAFADSVTWRADQFDSKMSKDTLRAMFSAVWKEMGSMQVKMNDYESVISKDKKEEWVTLWYKQINTDKSGKVDSMAYVDDLKFVNGKITVLDEKGRRYPPAKK